MGARRYPGFTQYLTAPPGRSLRATHTSLLCLPPHSLPSAPISLFPNPILLILACTTSRMRVSSQVSCKRWSFFSERYSSSASLSRMFLCSRLVYPLSSHLPRHPQACTARRTPIISPGYLHRLSPVIHAGPPASRATASLPIRQQRRRAERPLGWIFVEHKQASFFHFNVFP